MLQQYTVSRDDSIYEAFPDLVQTATGELICVFLECEHHSIRKKVRIVMTKSTDNGRTWSPKMGFTEICKEGHTYNCPRISRLPDNSLVVLCDCNGVSEQHLWRSFDNGQTWKGPEIFPFHGIVPDKYQVLSNGRHIFAIHDENEKGKLEQYAYYSDDSGKTWTKTIVASDERYNLCEASILEVQPGILIAFMRENSFLGYCCKKTISYDFGTTWSSVYDTNIDCCHRPVAGFYEKDKILLTYRYMQGGKGWLGSWTQNLFGAFFDVETALATERSQQSVRIFPIAFDRSPQSDTAYSGWVRQKNGEFYVVNYLLDDAPKAQIRGYSFSLDDVILPEIK